MNLQEIPFIIYAEETPNPGSLKFVANKLLLVSGATAEYQSASETKDAPIAQVLFNFPFVKRVFISSNFISIAKTDAVEWEEIRDELRVFITEYLNKGNAVVNKLPQKEVAKDNTFKETSNKHRIPRQGTIILTKTYKEDKSYTNMIQFNDERPAHYSLSKNGDTLTLSWEYLELQKETYVRVK